MRDSATRVVKALGIVSIENMTSTDEPKEFGSCSDDLCSDVGLFLYPNFKQKSKNPKGGTFYVKKESEH